MEKSSFSITLQKSIMKPLLLYFLILFSFAQTSCFSKDETSHLPNATDSLQKKEQLKLHEHALQAAAFARKQGYNTSFCFLIDMSRYSGSNRFVIYNLEKDMVDTAGLVAHGRCNKMWLTGRQYSNKPNCGCTSLGKYKIGKPYQGRFGLAYKLYGLDPSNSNAFQRYIVLHSHDCVPVREVTPMDICQSDGCPMVTPVFLSLLAKKIDRSPKPILLWIYE